MFLVPHLGAIIWTTLIFCILLYILGKFAWKPLLKALESREQSVEKSLSEASAAEKKISNLKEEQQAIILAAKLEKEQIVKEGIDQRDKIIATARDKAKIEVDKLIEESRKQINREREAALVEMKNQIAALSIEIATKIVHIEMEDKKRHEKLVEDLIKEVKLN
jgi:F-type H+-transporting ATPase subunit b